MKRIIYTMMALVAMFALAGCNNAAQGEGGTGKAVEDNLKNAYNFIQPSVSMGIARDALPEDALPPTATDPISVSGNPVEHDGITYFTFYSWMGTEQLKLIEYTSTESLSAEQYDALLQTMTDLYGTPRLLSEIDAEIHGTDALAEATSTPAETADSPQPENEHPAQTWRYENINISLYYLDGKAIIDFIMN